MSVNSKLCDRVTSFERQCWASNQYTRRECLEITGRPESTKNGNLEDLTLKVLNEIGVNIDSKNVENCHCFKTQDPKEVKGKGKEGKEPNFTWNK